MNLRRFLYEIHRRSIWQVLAVYLFGAWIGYEVILALQEGLGLPAWLPGFAIVLFVIGLPLVVATALVQEGPPQFSDPDLHLLDDIELADDQAEGEPSNAGDRDAQPTELHHVLTWRNAFFTGVLGFALWGVVAAAWLAFGGARAVVVPPDSAGASQLAEQAGALRVEAEPDATVRVRAIGPGGALGDPERLGDAPTTGELPSGEYVVELEHADHNPLVVTTRVEPDSLTVLEATLAPATPEAAGMVLVPAGDADVAGRVDAPFLIDRHEVTNAAYLEFMGDGGYGEAAYWPDTMLIDGEPLPRSQALDTFVDDTGIQAPRGWSGGIHPEGEADHPVVGVTWYEAGAYLRWAGKELPSLAQWRRAAVGADGRLFPWGSDQSGIDWRANFSLVGTRPVGSFPAGLSPFGVADMAGNVREWLRGTAPDRKPVVGGSWLDPAYMFEQVESFAPDFTNNAIGFRGVRPFREP